jgi:hypothetical protein
VTLRGQTGIRAEAVVGALIDNASTAAAISSSFFFTGEISRNEFGIAP